MNPDEMPELRQVSDARSLRALAHPVRIALLEALSLRGPMTATEVGEVIGESPTTCSFHLRQLAKYGFVEEAGGGKGRARPWRMTSLGMTITTTEADPEADLAASVLSKMLVQRMLGRYQHWWETRASYPKAWREAAGVNQHVIYLTPDELRSLGQQLSALLTPQYRERLTDPSCRPKDALAVELVTLSYPVDLAPAPATGPAAARARARRAGPAAGSPRRSGTTQKTKREREG